MSDTVDIDGQRLTVPQGWWVWRYDDSSFHRNQFQSLAGGSKAMDAVAWSDKGILWLIELKDYRRHRRVKPSSVFAEVASKARTTLAGLATAQVRANDPSEKSRAQQTMRCTDIRVALQIAQPVKPSRLFPQVVNPQDAQLLLRKQVRAIDPHPICHVGASGPHGLPWTTVDL